MGTVRFVGRTVGQYLLVLAVALTINFLLPRALPGGPLATLGGGDVFELSATQREALLAEYDLDGSLLSQFWRYLGDLASFDLGRSFADGRPVTDHIADGVWWTLLLVGSTLLLTTLIGVVAGAVAATRRERRRDGGLLAIFVSLDALPAFWVGLLAISTFAVTLGWFPSFGAVPTSGTADGWTGVFEIAHHLTLPLATLLITGVAQTFLVVRYSMIAELGSDHLQFARVRGLPRRRIVLHHGLRNAALPIHTHVLLEVGYLVGGAVIVETVFAYPGLGRMTFDALGARDYPVLQGGFLVLTVAVIATSAIAELTYPLLDPRVRRPVAA
jgi:peptide/nickel transport system permease protein